jgi:hypothetical protein
VTGNSGFKTVSVLLNRGDGSFEPRLDYRAGFAPESIALGDLNGDDKQDLAAVHVVTSTVSVLINTPGLCTVQNVREKKLPVAKQTLARANCRLGKIRRVYSKLFSKGVVISEQPKAWTVLRKGGRVNLVVSRGRKH